MFARSLLLAMLVVTSGFGYNPKAFAKNVDSASSVEKRTDTPHKAPLENIADTSIGATAFYSVLKLLFALAAVIALAYLVLHKGLGKLVQKTRSSKNIRVLERVPLDQRRALYLVEVQNRVLLLGSAEGGISHISTLDANEKPHLTFEQTAQDLKQRQAATRGP